MPDARRFHYCCSSLTYCSIEGLGRAGLRTVGVPKLTKHTSVSLNAKLRSPPSDEADQAMQVNSTTLSPRQAAPAPMREFGRYPTGWVFLCIVAGIALG